MPDLDFRVEDAEVLKFAAVPTLLFKLRIEILAEEPIRSVSLNTQILLAAQEPALDPVKVIRSSRTVAGDPALHEDAQYEV